MKFKSIHVHIMYNLICLISIWDCCCCCCCFCLFVCLFVCFFCKLISRSAFIATSQAFQHHVGNMDVYVSIRITKCIHHILLDDHVEHQTTWICERCTNALDDKHLVPPQHYKAAPTTFPWTHFKDTEDEVHPYVKLIAEVKWSDIGQV